MFLAFILIVKNCKKKKNIYILLVLFVHTFRKKISVLIRFDIDGCSLDVT